MFCLRRRDWLQRREKAADHRVQDRGAGTARGFPAQTGGEKIRSAAAQIGDPRTAGRPPLGQIETELEMVKTERAIVYIYIYNALVKATCTELTT